MLCPKCESENVNVQVITKAEVSYESNHGVFWWVVLILWCVIVFVFYTKWFVLIVPALIFIVSGHKEKTVSQKHISVCVCQDCGHNWKINQV